MLLTYEEAREMAIAAGALKPQGLMENIACGTSSHNDWSFRWANTPRARARLEAWTNAILSGVHPSNLK